MATASADLESLRERIIQVGIELLDRGLTQKTFGNVSARVPADRDRFAITPTSVPYYEITREQVPIVTLEGERITGTREPSTETIVHRIVYEDRDDLGALIHTHSPYATVFACLGQPIRPYHNALAHVGGDVSVCDYANNGTEALGERAREAMAGRKAVLLQNHGVLAGGETLEDAQYVASIVEFCARMQYCAQLLGDPIPVPPEDLEYLSDYYRKMAASASEGGSGRSRQLSSGTSP